MLKKPKLWFSCLAGVPDDADCLGGTSIDTGCLAIFGFACGTCILDLLTVLLQYCGNSFILKIDEFGYYLKRFFGANSYASTASVAFV